MQTYRQLDEREIAQTLTELRDRIGQRFPQAKLREVCEQLITASAEASACVAYLRKPNWKLRIAGGIAIGALLVLLGAVVKVSLSAPGEMAMADIVQTVEAAVNDIVFFGVAVFFLASIETRVKRHRALEVLHQLRSLSHIVDMHQLTKDPERLASPLKPEPGTPNAPRPKRATGADLARYLDFCSELLSLISKIAALLVQDFNDSVVLAGVNEIEGLTTGLSGKIWQKITILERSTRQRA